MVARAGAQSLLHLALHVPIGSDPERGEQIQEPYRQEGGVAGRLLPMFRRKYEPKTWKVEWQPWRGWPFRKPTYSNKCMVRSER